MLCHVVLDEGRIHQKPVLFLGTFLRSNHNHSQMDTTCLGSIHVCCPSMGDALMAFFWSQRDKQMSSPCSFLNASYCFTRSSCCLLQPSLSLPPASVIIFLYAGVSGITGVEQHQNPSYECIKRGPAKWALATLEINTCNEGDKLQKDYSPHSQTSVCAVSDISCASTLKPSLI